MTAEGGPKQEFTIDGLAVPVADEKRHFFFKCLNASTVDVTSRLLAECIGTAFLMLFGCASGLAWQNQPADFVGALGFGLVVMIIVQCFGEISGAHVNPAVSLCALVHRTLSISMFIGYVIAQVLGSFVGFGLLVLLTPTHIFRPNPEATVGHCSTVPLDGMNISQTFVIEFMATMVLITLCCASWDPRNASKSDSVALKFGFAVAGLSLAFGPATGCSMNPARSLGPAIWNNDWTLHWLYWVGPLSSSLVTTVVYKAIFAVQPSAENH